MIDPNVTSYFIVILSGFGVVWGFRHWTKSTTKLGEFEYAALSTLCGIPLATGFLFWLADAHLPSNVLSLISQTPMLATLPLFGLGVVIGRIGAAVLNLLKAQSTLCGTTKTMH